MFQSLLSIKLAAMAAALGLNTEEWKSPTPEMVKQVTALETAMGSIGDASKAEKVQSDLNEAIKAIAELAKNGDKDAQYAMGLFSQQQQQNQQGGVEQAVRFYELAAKQGQLQAMNNLGTILAMTSRDAEKATEGATWLEKAAAAGNNPARRNLAQILVRGAAGRKPDPDGAEKLLQTALAGGDDQAAYDLAQFYLGAGGKDKTNEDKAWEMLNKATEMKNVNALDTMGTLLLNGGKFGSRDIKADPATAVKNFKTLADQKNPVGLRRMGGIYQAGLAGEKQDFMKALEMYRQAAQGNDAIAQFQLASMYDTGVDLDPKDDKIEVPQNAAAALNLYRAAAQNNLAVASYNVGVFYEQGRTVDRDPAKAFAFFQQAAQAGVALGMQKVGVYYLNGVGTLKDPVAATGWFARSAAAGLPEGHLNYGVVTELGLGTQGEADSPFYSAGQSYLEASDMPQASDPVRMEALLRLGNLYFRGVMVAKGDAPKPDYERAYQFFTLASQIDPKNETAAAARGEAQKKLTVDQIRKADGFVEQKKKDREARKAKAEAAAKGGADAGAPPAATPVPAATPAAPATGKKPATR